MRTAFARADSGLSLIELLIVSSILVMLISVALPLLNMAHRLARASETRSVMAKVDVAARLFREEHGPYPYQIAYADLAAGEAWTNRLFYQLGTTISQADFVRVMRDADAAAANYASSGCSRWAFDWTDISSYDRNAKPRLHNRMAAERARMAIYAGNTGITGPQRQSGPSHLSTDPLLKDAVAASTANPGLAKDYLAGEVEARFVRGAAVLDAWGRPLIYVCQVIEGMRTAASVGHEGTISLDTRFFGMNSLGRTTLLGPDADGRPGLDSITRQPVQADAARGLPDLGNLRHSDRRNYAPQRLELEFELWSAGPDGKANWMRDAGDNRDNVALVDYDKGLP